MLARLSAAGLSLLAALAHLGCADGGDSAPPGRGFDGPGVAVNLAALNLVGVGDVVWDVEVLSGASPAGQVVWQRRLTSSGYGDGAGSASYVGPCDASAGATQNTVRVWVVGLYDAPVSAANAGQFNSGATTAPGTVAGTAIAFRNPTTAAAPLTRTVTCVDNADVPADFDVTLMRPADQGFFDVAVNFNAIFCSAKFDCCRDVNGSCEDIELLFDGDGDRVRTFVLGFACTAGTASGVVTHLYLDKLALDCSAPNGGGDFAADITVSPGAATAGNLCTAGAGTLSGCPAIAEPGGRDADLYLHQAAVFRGDEPLQTGGAAANKVFWNVALGVRAPIADCVLRARATADNAADAGDHVDGGTIGAGTVYPYVAWDVDLDACADEQLDDGSGMVATAYTGLAGAGYSFAYSFAPGTPPVRVCPPGALLINDTCVPNVDLIVNGTFDTDVSSWNPGVGTWHAAGAATISTSPFTGGTDYFYQTVATIPGVTYRLRFDVLALSGPAGVASYVFAANGDQNPRNGTKLAAATVTTTPSAGREYVFVALTTATIIVLATEVQVGNSTLDNLSLYIVP